MKKKFLIICTDGFSETQLSVIRETLIKDGFDVDIAAKAEKEYVKSNFNLKVVYDYDFTTIINRLVEYKGLFIPGGSGLDKLDLFKETDTIINHFIETKKIIATIADSPILLAKRQFLVGKNAVCYPSKHYQKILVKNGATIPKATCKTNEECSVIIDDNIITGLNTETIIKYSQELIKLLYKKN